MASKAQCFYCFECLSANFEDRDPFSLSRVEDLWEEYQTTLMSEDDEKSIEATPQEQSLRVKEGSALEDSENTDDEDIDPLHGDEDDEDNEDDEDDGERKASAPSSQPLFRPQLPSISRLQASSSTSTSQSSSSLPSPSILSANSSNSALATPGSSTTSIPRTPPPGQRTSYSSQLSRTASYPIFVTWSTVSRTTGHKSLRGCIGTFEPLPLASGLQSYALTSAFEDTRFNPIPATLLPSLSCNITLLANFETCAHPLDWSLGTHGLRISFVYRSRRHGATYLPDVAVEQGWTKEETLESLMRKSGWDGGGSGAGSAAMRFLRGGRDRAGAGASGQKPWEEVSNFTTVRYTGWKAGATYGEWKDWRSWVEGRKKGVLR